MQQVGELTERYNQYCLAEDDQVKQGLLYDILSQHKFVKSGAVEELDLPQHRFEIQRFQLDVRGFQRWLNRTSEGKVFRSVGGGVSDDALYTLSPMLRELLPRGLHSVLAFPKEGIDAGMTQLWFRGIPKFTGLLEGDEDEQSNSHQANFFYGGSSIDQADHLFMTRKSNGENAKMSLVVIDGVRYMLAGSKNTCLIWPAAEPSEKYYPLAQGVHDIGCHVGAVLSEWYRSKTEAGQDALFDEFTQAGYTTMMAELNRPW